MYSELGERIQAIPLDHVRSLTIGKLNIRPGMNKASMRWMCMVLCHIFRLRGWLWPHEPRHLVELRLHLRFEGELDALNAFVWDWLEADLCTGRQRRCIGRDLSVVFQIWVQDHNRWLQPSGVEELSKYLTKKVRGTGCGIRYVRSHMPAGEEEEGSVEFAMTKWNGWPLIRTSTWNPKHYANLYVPRTATFARSTAMLTVYLGDRRPTTMSCRILFRLLPV